MNVRRISRLPPQPENFGRTQNKLKLTHNLRSASHETWFALVDISAKRNTPQVNYSTIRNAVESKFPVRIQVQQ